MGTWGECDEHRDQKYACAGCLKERGDVFRAALVHARTELRNARDTDIGQRWLFHTIDPCLTHINGVLGEPDEHEGDE